MYIILSCFLPLSGQFEHFRNHESVFKEYQPYFESVGKNVSTVAGQSVTLSCDVRNLGDRYVSEKGIRLLTFSKNANKLTLLF
jgi:hypothetical protein